MDKQIRTLLLSFFFTLTAAAAANASNLAVRLGLWHLTKPDFTADSNYSQSRQKNFFYAEATLENHLNHFLSLDISLGTLFRGTIRYRASSGSRFAGSANVLPVSLGITIYPVPLSTGIQPYLRGGGTVALGNSNSGNVTGIDASGNPILDSKTRFTAGYFVAAGLKQRIVSKVSLTAEFGYHQLRFSGPVAGISNHSGYKILAGVNINYK